MTPHAGASTVLVVEDDAFIAFDLERWLTAAGYLVIGPCASLDTGIEAAGTERVDAAVLDINLAGTLVYPLADLLCERTVPFLFVTGYSMADLPPRFLDRPVCRKPCMPDQIVSILTSMGATGATGNVHEARSDAADTGRSK